MAQLDQDLCEKKERKTKKKPWGIKREREVSSNVLQPNPPHRPQNQKFCWGGGESEKQEMLPQIPFCCYKGKIPPIFIIIIIIHHPPPLQPLPKQQSMFYILKYFHTRYMWAFWALSWSEFSFFLSQRKQESSKEPSHHLLLTPSLPYLSVFSFLSPYPHYFSPLRLSFLFYPFLLLLSTPSFFSSLSLPLS